MKTRAEWVPATLIFTIIVVCTRALIFVWGAVQEECSDSEAESQV